MCITARMARKYAATIRGLAVVAVVGLHSDPSRAAISRADPVKNVLAQAIAAREGQELLWVKPDMLHLYDMPPADEPLKIAFRDLS